MDKQNEFNATRMEKFCGDVDGEFHPHHRKDGLGPGNARCRFKTEDGREVSLEQHNKKGEPFVLLDTGEELVESANKWCHIKRKEDDTKFVHIADEENGSPFNIEVHNGVAMLRDLD